jgi:DNA-3-methyladenine glycosylase
VQVSPHQLFFARPALVVAQTLVGATLTVDDRQDRSLSTRRSCLASQPRHVRAAPGTAYVYRSCGIYWCLNAVCVPGSAVRIRAIEPLLGIERMQERRSTMNVRLLCSGPGRVCAALSIDGTFDGLPLDRLPFHLDHEPPIAAPAPFGDLARSGLALAWCQDRDLV